MYTAATAHTKSLLCRVYFGWRFFFCYSLFFCVLRQFFCAAAAPPLKLPNKQSFAIVSNTYKTFFALNRKVSLRAQKTRDALHRFPYRRFCSRVRTRTRNESHCLDEAHIRPSLSFTKSHTHIVIILYILDMGLCPDAYLLARSLQSENVCFILQVK